MLTTAIIMAVPRKVGDNRQMFSFVCVLQGYLTQKSASGNELQIFFQGIRSQLSESMTDVIAKLEEEEVGIVR